MTIHKTVNETIREIMKSRNPCLSHFSITEFCGFITPISDMLVVLKSKENIGIDIGLLKLKIQIIER